MGNL
jgi:hypothetical protein